MNKMLDLEYRVIRLSDSLRKEMRRVRDATDQTNEQLVAGAVEKNLPILVKKLVPLGFKSAKGELHPTRLPFSIQKGTLGQLAKASKATGIPAVYLLRICLENATAEKSSRRKSRRRR